MCRKPFYIRTKLKAEVEGAVRHAGWVKLCARCHTRHCLERERAEALPEGQVQHYEFADLPVWEAGVSGQTTIR